MRLAVTVFMLLAVWYACDRGARFTVARFWAKEDVGRAPVGHDEPCPMFGTSRAGCRTRREPKDSELRPRNGHTLIVGIVARISGCADQREVSLADQEDHAKQVVVEMYDAGPVEYQVVATIGKGEALDRPELEQIEAQLRRRELDLLVMEDLGRLVRGADATRILGVAVDHDTRVIVVNDNIDTADESWEQEALRASGEHVGHNVHTSRRLKHKLMNRFRRSGAAPGRPVAGYDVPPGAKTYFDWELQADATPVIREGLRILRETGNCSAVAEYLNAAPWRGGFGFPTGPYCRRTTWDGKMVRRFYANRILGGAPGRGFRHTVKRHGKGRRVSVKNPLGPKFIECPNLAHVDLVELDAVNAGLARRNGGKGRKAVDGVDPCLGVARKDTRFPGRSARCWYCGRSSVWGGNGIAGHLMCPGAREWRCWCAFGFDGALAKGYKLHAVWAADGRAMPLAWAVTPLDVDEKRMAARLVRRLGDAGQAGYLVGDGNYDAGPLHAVAAAAGHQLVAPRQKPGGGLGHRPQPPARVRCVDMVESPAGVNPFGPGLLALRGQVERDFGNLVGFGGGLTCLPPWVRRPWRVRRWVFAKLLINAARIRIRARKKAVGA